MNAEQEVEQVLHAACWPRGVSNWDSGSGLLGVPPTARIRGKMVLPQNHFVQNELPQFNFIECSILDIHYLFCQTPTDPAGKADKQGWQPLDATVIGIQ